MASPIVHSGRARPAHAGAVDALVATQVRRWMRLLAMRGGRPHLVLAAVRGVGGHPTADADAVAEGPRLGRRRRTARRLAADEDGRRRPSCRRGRRASPTRSWPIVSPSAWRHGASRTDATWRTTPGPVVNPTLSRRSVVHGSSSPVRGTGGSTRIWWRPPRRPCPSSRSSSSVLSTGRCPRPPTSTASGRSRMTSLPAHLQFADVGIVPYRRGAFNDASCPLKVYEYLAAGLPVVSTGVGHRRAAGRPRATGRRCRRVRRGHSRARRSRSAPRVPNGGCQALVGAPCRCATRGDRCHRQRDASREIWEAIDVSHVETQAETQADRIPSTRQGTRWKLIVSAVLVIWLGAQFVAGWKFAN